MIVEMSENIGQLKIEPYEKIVRLNGRFVWDEWFTNSTRIKMRYHA